MKRKYRMMFGAVVALLLAGFSLPEPRVIPVAGARIYDWNPRSFWYEPWGASGVHKGIDIFSTRGKAVLASTDMLILFKGEFPRGGNVIIGLGPKWRLHYFAHLQTVSTSSPVFVSAGHPLGTVGSTGNAQGKQPHLHYSILNVIPRPWRMDNTTQGYKKAFYIDPGAYLKTAKSLPAPEQIISTTQEQGRGH